jgi:hypothetical protein
LAFAAQRSQPLVYQCATSDKTAIITELPKSPAQPFIQVHVTEFYWVTWANHKIELFHQNIFAVQDLSTKSGPNKEKLICNPSIKFIWRQENKVRKTN